jgi:hypothetical protein
LSSFIAKNGIFDVNLKYLTNLLMWLKRGDLTETGYTDYQAVAYTYISTVAHTDCDSSAACSI